MRHAWRRGSFTVTEVHGDLAREGDSLAFTTLSTLIERIREKGYLTRSAEREGYSFIYSVRIPLEEALGLRIEWILQDLVVDDPQLLVLRAKIDERTS